MVIWKFNVSPCETCLCDKCGSLTEYQPFQFILQLSQYIAIAHNMINNCSGSNIWISLLLAIYISNFNCQRSYNTGVKSVECRKWFLTIDAHYTTYLSYKPVTLSMLKSCMLIFFLHLIRKGWIFDDDL